jgi:predicted deacylase
MAKTFKLGPIEVEPGTRKNELFPVGKTPDGSTWGIPLIVINGVREGPRLFVNGAVHGDEVEGTAAIQEVADELDSSQLTGTFIGAPVVSVAAYIAPVSADVSGMRENPIDWKNLNRVAPGRPDGTVTDRLAYAICNDIFSHVDYHIDIHAGGTRGTSIQMAGFTPVKGEFGRKSVELAKCFPVQILWKTPPWGKIGVAAREKGVLHMAYEATGQGRADDEDVQLLITGIKNVMKHLGMIEGELEDIPEERRVIDKETYVYAQTGGLLRPTVRTGDLVSKGDLLGVVKDAYGTVVEEFTAPFDGVVTGIRTKPVVWAGEPVFLASTFITIEDAMREAAEEPAVTPP